ncbi:MAG: ribokinase [Anaerolineales bacterium]|nr:ribokinase [Anaerolineales bacterium]MCB0008242.1 ribokinase [Anaerolineales bacterium]MCB0017812.1 ribokinase [Anaerolineales bacterium]MCB0028641.1 ribokinase [Anaerolineales bacterium]MCB8959220.1 ribokinase [Ardenticatenales bacterium]
MSIVVLGSISMDLTTYVPRLPAPGETLFGSHFITVPGGKGFNQALAASRLGADTKFVGRLGDDAFGAGVREFLAKESLDITNLITDPENASGLAVISVDEAAENSIIVISGTNMKHDERDVARAEAAMANASVLMLQLETPQKTSFAAARIAKEMGVKVMLDPAPAVPLDKEVYELCYLMTPNEGETEILTGIRPENQTQAAEAASILLDRGVDVAVIKLGATGVYFQSATERGFVQPFKVNAIDTVAAGDAFNGGVAAALDDGQPLAEAVRWGAAAGALATTRAGASTSMPYRDELLALLSQ